MEIGSVIGQAINIFLEKNKLPTAKKHIHELYGKETNVRNVVLYVDNK